jgi:hypothetical protein
MPLARLFVVQNSSKTGENQSGRLVGDRLRASGTGQNQKKPGDAEEFVGATSKRKTLAMLRFRQMAGSAGTTGVNENIWRYWARDGFRQRFSRKSWEIMCA